MGSKNSEYYFLRGGGEMGELIRAKDWSKTSLGDPADWPQSLCTMVAVMLDNPFGMYIAWGSEYIQLYNDGYRPILGTTKHPQALGIGTPETFSEIWHIIASMFDGVMKGKGIGFPDFMLPLNRNGFVEECYFDFSYSPIRKNDGEVGGVLVTVIETTDKKKAEERLKESNDRFRNTMKQAPVGITILRGPQYIVEMANDIYLQLLDKKEAEFVGNPLFASLPEVEEVVHPLLDSVLNTGVPYHGYEVPIPVNRYGKQDVFYFDFLYHPRKDEDGKISGVIVAVTEVTEKVQARKKVEERKRLYEAITQNTPDLIYVFDLNYRFTYANEALLKMWGRTWDDSIGKRMLEVGYQPWHAQMHEREIDEVIATKKTVRGEVSFPHATLGDRIYDYIFAPVIDQDGKVEAIAGTTRDITTQIEARKKIEESEERFRSLAQTLPQLVWVTDAQGNAEFASLRWKEYAGIEPRSEAAWKELVHPDDYDNINTAWVHSLTTGEPYVFDVRLRNKDGEYRWHAAKGEPVLDKDNKIVKWVGAFTDIQDQKIREEKKDEFISIASHELKTPLTTAQAYLQILELLLDGNNKEANLYAKKASQSVRRLNELISELLDVSKIQLGKLNYTLTTFNFNNMIENTVENVQLTSKTHSIIKTGNVYDEVTGDEDRLQQVIVNLLINAIKYSPGADKVFIALEQEEDMIKVSVKDLGIGIAKHSLDKIFEKYHRVEEHAVHFQGLGIGLFISYEIIQRHHGKLWAESEAGKGSTFYFTIPVKGSLPS
ncbi:PAS domain-containing sensor histidine kinase [Ginsengibacter hankyongi]|uniref:histidine kinase n=1 Tax=Ginsengibacter hankyongi TaxID=2607284 RepID=A0A5J5ICZ0_9BACT|nr:PAS domain-containing sensor histidine kinase [Ginsengibacter hankyongi]KAA9035926.1 PAS domain-containing sensor histidine kinase [Ginsengibacter hankyongi]